VKEAAELDRIGDFEMLDRMIEKASEQDVFSRGDTPIERRVEAAFLYQVGLSYSRVERAVGRSYEGVRHWYHRLAHLFDPEPDHKSTVTVDEMKIRIEDVEVYIWAAIDVDTFEVVYIGVSPGHSDLDVLLFLKQVLKRCRGQPVIVGDCGPWYNWVLDDLDLPCNSRWDTWRNDSSSKLSSACSNTETGSYTASFPTTALGNPSIAGPKPSSQSTISSANLDTLPSGSGALSTQHYKGVHQGRGI